METLQTLTAAEIDGRIASAEYAAMAKHTRAADLRKLIERTGTESSYAYLAPRIPEYEAEIVEAEAALAWCRAVIEAGEEVYRERGTWKRYYLVVSSIGHVHRERHCPSCYYSTEYAWLTELSDCVESEMIEAWGEKACTVCFPEAPVHPAWLRSVAEREAEEAKKAETRCPGSGRYISGSYGRRYQTCEVCTQAVSVTSTGKFRAHKHENTGAYQAWRLGPDGPGA